MKLTKEEMELVGQALNQDEEAIIAMRVERGRKKLDILEKISKELDKDEVVGKG